MNAVGETDTAAEGSPARRTDYRSAFIVFVACLALYHLNGRPIAEIDCVAAPYTAWSLVRHGSFDIQLYPDLCRHLGAFAIHLPDGTVLSRYPPGSALAAVPFVAPFAAFRETPPRAIDMLNLGKLAAAVYVAGAAVLFFLTCRRLAPSGALAATILFAAGTCLWSVASQALWMHGPATFWLCAALYCLIMHAEISRVFWSVIAGFALGLAVVTRPSTALFLAASAPVLGTRRLAAAVGATLAALMPVGLFVVYNLHYFGRPIAGGYGDEAGLWHASFAEGLTGLLVAPSRGLLVYTPALLLLPWGVRLLGRSEALPTPGHRDVILSWSVAALATVCLYAKWHCWSGGWCFGPRFLCETMPVFCLVFALAYEQMAAGEARRVAQTLVARSVLIHALGVFGNDPAWKARHERPRSLFALHDTQIEAHARRALHKLAERLARVSAAR
jgi:hypothetical protein